jgi:pimeloyl-ACP methyl ester carboxylesterase
MCSMFKRVGMVAVALAAVAVADDAQRLLRMDHYVPVRSTAPSMSGQTAQIYVREVTLANALRRRPAADRVVLFIHGAGTPAEVAFDVPYKDFSWMAYLANEGFDVFSMDMTGYGRSTRPTQMNDAKATSGKPLTTMGSDWNDIGAVVDYLRSLRGVERLSLIGWSQGAPRAGGYTSQHPDKVSKLVLFAPAYNRKGAMEPPASFPANTVAFNTQSHADFMANWTRQIGCPDQYVPEASDAVWKAMLESDPVGATWDTGVRRAPNVPTWGWNPAVVAKMKTPLLAISAANDKQALPERIRELYTDFGGPQKIFVDLACSSHNALWENNHLLLFRASYEFLTKGTVNGSDKGEVRIGY